MWIEVILILLTLYVLWTYLRRPSNYPPGLWGIPLIGHIPFGMKKIEENLNELNRNYGPVVSWRVGNRLLVFIFDFQMVKEAFLGTQYMERPESRIGNILDGDKQLGILYTNGVHWQTLRRFSLRHLRDLGMGKSRLSVAIQNEATQLVEDMKKVAGKPTSAPHSITIAVLNVIWQMIASKRYQLDDKELLEFEGLINEFKACESAFIVQDFFPWVTKLLPEFLARKVLKRHIISQASSNMRKFLMRHIDGHVKTFDENDPRDFIDAYLIEMKNQSSDPESTMSMEDLLYCLSDMFLAGSETTAIILQWSMLYLAAFPKVQKRLQREIDDVLPKGTLPTLEDKAKLPYTEAFMHEVLRYCTIGPLGFMHSSSVDTKLGGYFIPKGAFIFSAIYSIHFNSKHFDFPKEFRPERFLDAEGKFVAPKEGFMPFGIGRRQCIGESLARMEYLIFLTTMLQSLQFDAPPGKTIDVNDSNDSPFIRAPRDLEVVITIR